METEAGDAAPSVPAEEGAGKEGAPVEGPVEEPVEEKPVEEPVPEKPGEGKPGDPGEDGVLADPTNDGAADTREGVQERMAPAPIEIGNSGTFNYAVPIDLPAFHGIEPNLAFHYDSGRKSVGTPDAIMGVGWQLSGLSKITRNTVGGGLPTYALAYDIFRLDGTDLLACKSDADRVFPNPYPWAYPEDRLASRENASCSLGDASSVAGNMVTLQDNFKKIRAQTQNYGGENVFYFVVTDQSGRQYTYRAPGVIASAPVYASGTPEYKIIYGSTWLLTEIRDAQKRPNIVQFHYSFDRSEGWAPTIRRISYGQADASGALVQSDAYNVYFLYWERTYAQAWWSIGRGVEETGQQLNRLDGVIVKEGGINYETGRMIRGYRIVYAETDTPSLLRHLVTQIIPYGSDLTLTPKQGTHTTPYGIAGGTALPAYKFTYSSDALRFSPQGGQTWPDLPSALDFHVANTVADVDGDGRDDAVFYKNTISKRYVVKDDDDSGDDRTLTTTMVMQPQLYGFTASREVDVTPRGALLGRIPENYSRTDGSVASNVGILTDWVDQEQIGMIGGIYVPGSKYVLRHVTEPKTITSFDPTGWSLNRFELHAINSDAPADVVGILGEGYLGDCTSRSEIRPLLGNFDNADPDLELAYGEYVFNVADGKIAVASGRRGDLASYCDGQRKIGANAWVADIDGDGVDEILNASHFYKIYDGAFKKLSYIGAGLPCEFYLASAYQPGCNLAPTINGYQHLVSLGDVNGDGAADAVIVYRKAGQGDITKVALSNGAGFGSPASWVATADREEGTYGDNATRGQIADVNGDGLGDFIWYKGYQASAYTVKQTYPTTADGKVVEPVALAGIIYLSNGRGFYRYETVSGTQPYACDGAGDTRFCLRSPIGTGDFNGDGQLDILSGSGLGSMNGTVSGRAARIYFNDAGAPYQMTKVTEPIGRQLTVAYSSSRTDGNSDNELPRPQQVVKRITEFGGTWDTFTFTDYEFTGGRFSQLFRIPVGFNRVLTKMEGDSAGGGVVELRRYYARNAAAPGRIIRQSRHNSSGQLLTDVTYTLSVNGTRSKLPFQVYKTAEVEAAYLSDPTTGALQPLTTRRTFINSPWVNVPYIVNDFGAVSGNANDGYTDLDPSDTTSTYFTYGQNLAKFIVGKPLTKTVQAGASPTSWPVWPPTPSPDPSAWLHREYYSYEGSDPSVPETGNIAKVEAWPGGAAEARHLVSAFTYDAYGNVATESDAGGLVAAHSYDADRHLFRIASQNALGHSSSTSWDTACQVSLSVTDANGLATSVSYDLHCREVQRTLPQGRVLETHYVGLGQQGQHIRRVNRPATDTPAPDDAPLQETWDYIDGLGHPYIRAHRVSDTRAVVNVSRAPIRGLVDRQYMPYEVDIAEIANVNPHGGLPAIWFSYDALDRAVKSELYSGNVPPGSSHRTQLSATSYLALPRVPLGSASAPYLQAAVRVQDGHCFDADAATLCGESTAIADASGRKIEEIRGPESEGIITRYGYDILGRLTTILDPIGARWDYTYDGLGRRITASDPGLGAWAMSYTERGQLDQQTDAKGNVIDFDYDALGRVTQKTVQQNTGGTLAPESVTLYSYDTTPPGLTPGANIGQMTGQSLHVPDTSAPARHEIARSFHVTGQVAEERQTLRLLGGDPQVFTFAYDYNSAGLLRRQSLPMGPGQTPAPLGANLYDPAGRLTAMTGYMSGLSYDAFGNLTGVTYANGVSEALSYDPTRGWLTSVEARQGTATLMRAALTRSVTGRIAAQNTAFTTAEGLQDAEGSYAYSYDSAGRLVEAAPLAGGAGGEAYAYDKGGRLTYKGPLPGGSSPALSYAYAPVGLGGLPDHAPESVTYNGTAMPFAYDANGNMGQGLHGKTMAYDAENRPLSVAHQGEATCYLYGADGGRLMKVEGLPQGSDCTALPGEAARTAYIGPLEVRALGAPAQVVMAYPAGAVRLTAANDSWTPAFLHKDHLGSVRVLSGPDGTPEERTLYRPYGAQSEVVTATLNDDKSWLGERYDAGAGLQYLNARYYDPELAMFLQPDWFEVMQPGVGTNRYAYANGDPINRLDPGGNGFWSDLAETVKDFFSGFGSGAYENSSPDKIVVGTALGAAGGAAIGSTGGAIVGGGVGGVPGGAGGALLGGIGGAVIGVIWDFSEIIAGGVKSGIENVQNGGDSGTDESGEGGSEGGGESAEQAEGAGEAPPADPGAPKGKKVDVPYNGPPDSAIAGKRRTRVYGPDGKPLYDIDRPHPGMPEPHVHEWDGPNREHPGRPCCFWPKE